MVALIIAEVLEAIFVSLICYWVIFKVWQSYHEGRHGKGDRRGIMTRSLVAGFNAGILGEVLIHLGPEKVDLVGGVANVVLWVFLGWVFGLIKHRR